MRIGIATDHGGFQLKEQLITDSFSAHQGVEDDTMNIMCLGGLVTGYALAWDLVRIFLTAVFKGDERFKRRLAKVAALEVLIHTSMEQEQKSMLD